MKLSTNALWLLLVAVSALHHQGCRAAVQGVPLEDLLAKLKLKSENEIEPPPNVVEEEIFPRARVVEVLSEARAAECSISIRNGVKNPSPIFLEANSEEFYAYDNDGVMQFNAGESVEMWCPDQFRAFPKDKLLTATCVSGNIFRVDGSSYNFNEFICKSWPAFVAQRTGEDCNGGEIIRVGFEIDDDRFIEQMRVCFDEDEEVTRYVEHALGPANDYFQNGVERLTFETGDFFGGKNVDKLYTQVKHQETINRELGGGADQYFNYQKNVFLSRGHMGAKADFVYGSQQRATFLFINAAPQWQTFNAGNWQSVEDGVRSYVTKNAMHVNCYTGVWGVTTLPNSKGEETPLYLDYDENHNGLIPVPKLYFRVIIEPATERGIVFIGVNNPHLSMEQIQEDDYVLCDDVSDQVTYINWDKNDLLEGYSYACEVEDFVDKVYHLPELSAPGGLLV